MSPLKQFTDANREKIMSEHKLKSFAELQRKAKELFDAMSKSERKVFEDRSAAQKKAFEEYRSCEKQALQAYKARVKALERPPPSSTPKKRKGNARASPAKGKKARQDQGVRVLSIPIPSVALLLHVSSLPANARLGLARRGHPVHNRPSPTQTTTNPTQTRTQPTSPAHAFDFRPTSLLLRFRLHVAVLLLLSTAMCASSSSLSSSMKETSRSRLHRVCKSSVPVTSFRFSPPASCLSLAPSLSSLKILHHAAQTLLPCPPLPWFLTFGIRVLP